QDYHFPGRFWPFQNPMISEVHSGYLECIKNGDNYLFITNQYFVGDDYAHHSPNRIPNALLNKIATSHAQNKPFHVYFCLSGVPGNDLETIPSKTVLSEEWTTLVYLFDKI